jgi:hypothetical protein
MKSTAGHRQLQQHGHEAERAGRQEVEEQAALRSVILTKFVLLLNIQINVRNGILLFYLHRTLISLIFIFYCKK